MSQDLGRVGSDFGRARGHSVQYTWRRRRGKRARMAMIPESSVLGDSTHDRISLDGLMQKKTELEQRDSREYRKFLRHFLRHFRIPYEILELVQLAKHRKWFSLAARDVAWRQYLPVVLKDSQSCC